jgi:putative membrane protein
MRINGVTAKAAAWFMWPLLASCSLLQETMPGITLSDANVMGVLKSLGQGEIDAAQLAQEKAAAPEVKAFAARVLKEHQELDRANGRLAEDLSLEPQPSQLVSQLRQSHEDAMRVLRATAGPAFDRAYVDHEIRQHVRALYFVEAAADSEATPRLKQELVRAGPDLLSHISAARALERRLTGEPPYVAAAR